MRTVYFSVDVETTGPVPSIGALLSVGIVTYREEEPHGWDSIYKVIKNRFLHCDPATLSWWMTQDPQRWKEATELGENEHDIAHQLDDWICDLVPNEKERCFVANPVAFDWPWINDLFLRHLGRNPFGHRALCIRSMHYGLTTAEWGGERSEWGDFEVKPEIPHNALSDAMAQREELIKLLKLKPTQ